MSQGQEEKGRRKFRHIGKPLPRHDAKEKVFGKTIYAGDYKIPGMLHVKVLRSQYPAALLKGIDVSEAEALPGVVLVMTAKDVPNNETVTRFGQTHKVGGFEGMYRVLADKKVRFMGEAVAIAAAETLEAAEQAIKLIKVDYEPLPGVFDPEEAMKPGAYQVGEEESNVVCSYKVRQGDVEEGFAQADVIVENVYRVPMVDHVYMEPEAGVAWIGEDGVLTIRVSTQVIEHFRGIADVLGLPHNKVRVIAPMVGGGFGGKEDITVESFLALVCWKTKRPVSMVFTREESIIAHSKRHAYVMYYKTGATRDGKITAVEAKLIQDAGAYVFLSPWVLLYSTVGAPGPYNIPHVKVDTTSVLTNNTFGSANRGFGSPQPCVAYEAQMDELAKLLGMTPLEIRQKNYLHTGDALATGRVLEHAVEVQATAEKAWEALGPATEPRNPSEKIGRGFASNLMSYGRMCFLHDTARSYVGVEMDGSVTVRCGVQDIGGGQASSLATIAAEVLGVSLDRVTVFFGDTALTPLAGTTTATRMLYMSGNATIKAATAIRESILGRAATLLEVPVDDLDIEDNEVFVVSSPEKRRPLAEVVKICASDGISLFNMAQFNAPARELIDFTTGQGQVWPDFTFGTQAMEVAVDMDTGRVNVLKLVSCYDIGQAINKLSVEGQIEGGAVYGMGYGLSEEVIFDHGITKTGSLGEYLIPSSLDAPDVQSVLIESGGGIGPFGAKGVGEPSCGPSAAALANAVADAIGTRVFQIPVTPERVLRAIKSKEKAGNE